MAIMQLCSVSTPWPVAGKSSTLSTPWACIVWTPSPPDFLPFFPIYPNACIVPLFSLQALHHEPSGRFGPTVVVVNECRTYSRLWLSLCGLTLSEREGNPMTPMLFEPVNMAERRKERTCIGNMLSVERGKQPDCLAKNSLLGLPRTPQQANLVRFTRQANPLLKFSRSFEPICIGSSSTVNA